MNKPPQDRMLKPREVIRPALAPRPAAAFNCNPNKCLITPTGARPAPTKK